MHWFSNHKMVFLHVLFVYSVCKINCLLFAEISSGDTLGWASGRCTATSGQGACIQQLCNDVCVCAWMHACVRLCV